MVDSAGTTEGFFWLLILLRGLLAGGEEQDSPSDASCCAAAVGLSLIGALLLPLVVDCTRTPDATEQQDSDSETSASWVESGWFASAR